MTDIPTKKFQNIENLPANELTADDFFLSYNSESGEARTVKESVLATKRVTPLPDITSIAALNPAALTSNQAFDLQSWRPAANLGGDRVHYDPNRPQTDHDGGTVFALGATPPTNFNDPAQIEAYLNAGSGLSGNGCLVRPNASTLMNPMWFGFVPDDANVDPKISTQAAIDAIYKLDDAGGTIFFMPGKHTFSGPVNPYNNVNLDQFGDITGVRNPRTVTPRINFVGQPGTVFIAPENGYIIDPFNSTPEAFYEIECHDIIFVGINHTGRPININRERAFPLRLKFWYCDFTNFEYGMIYTPLSDGGTNPRNGFIGMYSCYVVDNLTGLRTEGIDNVFLADTVFESNDFRGIDITTCNVFNMIGGKLQYNGDQNDPDSCQGRFSGTNRNINIQTYIEGGASSTEANNAGQGLASFILQDFIRNISFEGSYFNGLKSEAPFRSSFGKINGFSIRGCHFRNYQMDSQNRLFRYTMGSTGEFNLLNYDTVGVTIENMFNTAGDPLDATLVKTSIENVVADDDVYSFEPNQDEGIISVYVQNAPNGSGSVAYKTGASPAISALGSGVDFEVTTGELLGTTGVDGKITVSTHTDGLIYIENRIGASRNVVIKEDLRF